ncbi:hypothetical protein HZA56_12490 [Candidatus Poribacteria bacterium]|nr:hypothetical protein [Candidatus Poribacteria bacterium]
MKKCVLFLSVAAMVCLLVSPAWADGSEPDELQALKNQLMELNKMMQSQQQQIQEQGQKIKELEGAAKEPVPYADVEGIVEKVKADLPKPADGITVGGGKIKITPYGFLRLDMAYDDSAVLLGAGNINAWAWPEQGRSPVFREEDDIFSTTATATRLGFNFEGPEFSGGTLKGKLEFDFDESGANDGGGDITAHRIRLRHAYGELAYPTWSVLAGQTWDVVAPRIPNEIDCIVLWASGNVGYRRPQLRLTKWWDLDGKKITAQVSANAADRKAPTAGAASADDLDNDGILDGTDSGFPVGQARIGLDTVIIGERKLGIGLSGAVGREQLDFPARPGDKQDVEIWLVALDGSVTVIPNLLTVQGEIWTGQDVDVFWGGILQGVEKERDNWEPVEASGGFIHAMLTPRKDLMFNLGYGLDNVDSEDLELGDRSFNSTIFANGIWTVVPNFDIGLEFAWHETKWVAQANGDDFRVQTAFIYKF